MNILQVVDYFKPFWSSGGPARVCYEIARRFADMGHKVTIYSNGERRASEEKVIKNQPTTVDGMTVWYFKNLSSYLLNKTNIDSPYLLPVIARRKLREFDVIHIHTYRSMITIPIWYYAKKYGIPYTLQAHGSLGTFLQKGWLKRIFDKLWGYRILRDAAKVIALTQTEAGQYKSMGVSEDKIEIVPNGIDLSEFENLPQRGEFRSKYGLNRDQKMVLYLGRIHQTKGVDLLARVFAKLPKEVGGAKLVIVGPDDGYLPALQRLLEELQIQGKVLLTGPVYGRDKLRAYVDADVFVTPSFYGFPVTFMEACATGTPIVTTERGDYLEWLDGQIGYVTPYDEKELTKAITTILGNRGLAEQFGSNGRQIVKDRFNWDSIAEQIERVYANTQKGAAT